MDLVLSHDGKLIAFFKERPSGDLIKIAALKPVADLVDNSISDMVETITLEKIFSNSPDISIWSLSGEFDPHKLGTKMFYLNDESGKIFMALKMLKENHNNIRFANITLPDLFSYYGL